MTIALFAFSGSGNDLKARLKTGLEQEGHAIFPESSASSLSERVAPPFREAEALIFIGACGIAVRGIAPFVSSKTTDPAVLVIDEKATWVISLLSGHIGGANELARRVADLLDAQPVITTATDIQRVFAVDLWAKRRGFVIDSLKKARMMSVRLLAGEEVPVKSEYPLPEPLPQGLKPVSPGEDADFGMAVSIYKGEDESPWLHIIPRSVYLGIGCRNGRSQDMLARVVSAALEDTHIDARSVAGAGTIDLKKDEPGLIALCRDKGWTLHSYSAEQLMALPGSFTASAFVESVTGADNVCERAALMASGGGRLLFGKYAGKGVTVAAAEKPLTLNFEGF